MDSVQTAKQLWRQKRRVAVVLVIAAIAALLVPYRPSLSPFGLQKRSLQLGAASSQILVDSPQSTLVTGESSEAFDTFAARARVFGQYLSSLQSRARIAALSHVPASSLNTSGPFSPESGQVSYENQPSASRANELVKEGAQNRLVFTVPEGVPIITVNAQADTVGQAVNLSRASFTVLGQYVRHLEATDGHNGGSVTVRQLGAPAGGTIGGSNDTFLMILAFLTVTALGCALILIFPGLARRWRSLDELQRLPVEETRSDNGASANGVSAAHLPGEALQAHPERAAPDR